MHSQCDNLTPLRIVKIIKKNSPDHYLKKKKDNMRWLSEQNFTCIISGKGKLFSHFGIFKICLRFVVVAVGKADLQEGETKKDSPSTASLFKCHNGWS